jgi:hypothetical protein
MINCLIWIFNAAFALYFGLFLDCAECCHFLYILHILHILTWCWRFNWNSYITLVSPSSSGFVFMSEDGVFNLHINNSLVILRKCIFSNEKTFALMLLFNFLGFVWFATYSIVVVRRLCPKLCEEKIFWS